MGKKKDVPQDDNKSLGGNPRVATVHEHTIINGHRLPAGTVVTGMSAEDIAKHRGAGVPLDDVEDDDAREEYDVSEPYVAEDKGEDGNDAA